MRAAGLLLLLLAACKAGPAPAGPATPPPPATPSLAEPAAFAGIADQRARALALFAEAGKVLQHPRCVNCHPDGERPLQGDAGRPHQPLVVRGDDGRGAPGLPCAACHGEASYLRVPGSPGWRLAPAEMAWVGRSLGQICAQLKDPARNGGKSLAEIARHLAEDELVAYGWRPPAHLSAAPGDQARLGRLFQAWIDAGAHCPD